MRIILKIDGTTGLVMHNERLADPLDEYTKAIKEITSKGTKQTDTDRAEVARLEWFGGLYHDTDIGAYVPSWNVIRCIENAGKITKKGTAVIRALAPVTERLSVVYDGPRKPTELWERPEFRLRKMVGIQRNRVSRMRPIFRRWGLEFEVEFMEDVLTFSDFEMVAQQAGRSEGLCDARKLGYGRFNVEVIR